MKRIVALVLLIILCIPIVAGCSTEESIDPATLGESVSIAIVVKNFGTIKADLYPKIAPITVAHIVSLIQDEFYDGLIFHRVIDGFMIQGGDPTGTGLGDPGQKKIYGEFTDNGVNNNLKNTRGVLAMARSRDPNSATSQFFINTVDNAHLDGQYATFGRVTEGMDVVDAIAKVPTDAGDRPMTEVVIETIRIEQINTDAITTAEVTTTVPETSEDPQVGTDPATFGMVTEGMEVVDAIAKVQTDTNDRPLTDVVITSIRIDG